MLTLYISDIIQLNPDISKRSLFCVTELILSIILFLWVQKLTVS